MVKWAEILGSLSNEDSNRLFSLGREEEVEVGTALLQEGHPVDTLYFVLEGLFHVQALSVGPEILAILGHGEIIGEMSFIDPHPASATVIAIETSRVLAIPQQALRDFLAREPGMAASVYRSLAIIETRRLRQTTGHLSRHAQETTVGRVPAFEIFREAIVDFKQLLLDYDKAILKKDEPRVANFRSQIQVRFAHLSAEINRTLAEDSSLSEVARNLLGRIMQREMMPFIQMSETTRRAYVKPRGYAGDFLTIELIYQNEGSGSTAVGALFDACFLDEPAARAVRNRRALLGGEIQATLDAIPERAARVTSLACGPAREIFDVFTNLDDPERLEVTLVDMDPKALAHVSAIASQRQLQDRIRLACENLIYLAIGRGTFALAPQDLIYSIGLIDYFGDALVVKLIDYIHAQLRPGGRVILGNFHTGNPTRAIMDHVLEWNLIHRTRDDMDRLFRASAFKTGCTRIQMEAEGINMFAECVRKA